MSLYQQQEIKLYNTLTRQKEVFRPLVAGKVGMYVCGPTVYQNVHLGNCRTFISFDVMYRYLKHLGYQVRYVRNITDAGHMVGDGDEGEDKVAKQARLEQVEPMEIVQQYTVGFHHVMEQFNALPPSIEPTATGHIVEQIDMTQQIVENGYGYEIDGTIYCDVNRLNELYPYGQLSGRKLEDLYSNTRELDGQDQKRNPLDFALWKKAKPEHIQKWNSPWGTGFPGWHLECSAMSQKYLGEQFDIHGGGLDLAPTHHTNEIAQSMACCGTQPAQYWLHTNMLTVNGTKMSKSLGNSFLPHELFAGSHPLLEQPYSPMTVRFFFLQAHYRSTVDFSNEALQAAEKGYRRLMAAFQLLPKLSPANSFATSSTAEDVALNALLDECYACMNDDFNTPQTIAVLFGIAAKINAYHHQQAPLGDLQSATFERLKMVFSSMIIDVLGLLDETNAADSGVTDGLMSLILEIRANARANKDWTTSDIIRNQLTALGISVKDGKEGTTWNLG